MEPVQLQRATLPVSDLERSIAFYTEQLGFTLRSRTEYDTPALRSMFAIPEGASPELALLDAGEGQPRALALVYARGQAVDADANRISAPALLFNTRDLDEVHARMQAAGTTVLLPPTPLLDFSGQPYGLEAAYLDPDGVRIILFDHD